MISRQKHSKTTLWFLVGVVGGMVFLGWITLLPHQFSNTGDKLGLGEIKNAVAEEGGLHAIKSAAAELFNRDTPDAPTIDTTISLTNEQIRDLEQRVFDDPVR